MNIQRNRPAAQDYSRYTTEDFAVWKQLFKRQEQLLAQYACADYLQAIRKVGFTADRIPDIKQVNSLLQDLTGWQLTVVQGLVPAKDFFILLSQKIFPVTCWLRTQAELDYIEEPDMFHDVFGHVPLLANPAYADFMQAFGSLALQWTEQPDIIELLSRIYWYTIEFGLTFEEGQVKIYGAGILSSPGETLHSTGDAVKHRKFKTGMVLSTPYQTDRMQDEYFVVSSLNRLYTVLHEAEDILIHIDKQAIV